MFGVDIKQNFDEIISDDEYVTWASSPNFYAYIFSSVLLFVVAMSYGFFSAFDWFIKEISNTNVNFYLIFEELGAANIDKEMIQNELSKFQFNWAVLIHVLPIAFCVWNLFAKIKSHSKTHYAKTNKRIILRSGIWSANYTSINPGSITDSQVRVSFFDVLFRTGIITFKTGQVDSDGDPIVAGEMVSIPNPYDAYKILTK